MIVAESHGFPESDGGRPDAIGDNHLKMPFAVVYKIPAVSMAFPFRIDVDRTDDDRIVFDLAAGLADTIFSLGKVGPVIFGVLYFPWYKLDSHILICVRQATRQK